MRKVLLLVCMVSLAVYSAQASDELKSGEQTLWQKQLNLAKNINVGRSGADSIPLHLVNYVYKGVIESEVQKKKIIDSIFADDSPAMLIFPQPIVYDTIVEGNVQTIITKQKVEFDIVTMKRAREVSDSLGLESPIIRAKPEDMYNYVKVGFVCVELEWEYKGKTFFTLCIASDEMGWLFDPFLSTPATIIESRISQTIE